MKLYKNKLLVLTMLLSVIVLIERVAPNTTLNDRAVVVSLAIDYEGENIRLNAQILKPPESATESKSSSYSIIEGKGATLGLAIDEIAKASGLVVSLAHCNLLLVGETVMSSGKFPDIDNLVTNWLVPDQAVMVGVRGAAADMLKKHLTIKNVSGFYISQALKTNREHIDVIPAMVKDFLVEYNSTGGVSCLPILSAEEASRSDVDYTLVSDELPLNVFTINSGCAVKRNSAGLLLTQTECRAVNIMLYTSKKGEFTVHIEGYTIGLRLHSGKADIEYTVEDGVAKAKSSVKAKAVLVEVISDDAQQRNSTVDKEMEEQIRAAMKEKIEQAIMEAYERFTAENFDVFGLYGGLKSAGEDDWLKEKGDNYLAEIQFSVEVEPALTKTN